MTEHDKTPSGPRNVIHIGMGSSERLVALQDLDAGKLILIEAEAAQAATLARQAVNRTELHVIHAAIGPVDGAAKLQCWNLARLNSLHEPTPLLHTLFPGLRLKDRQSVPVLTPDQLGARIDEIEGTGGIAPPLHLILEVPGHELATLQAWKAADLLERTDQIELHAPEDILYVGALPRSDLEDWLVAEGFSVTSQDTEDPDWTILHLRIDRTVRALSRAEVRIAELTALSTTRDAALKAAEDRATRFEKALVDAKAAAETQAKALTERNTALKASEDRATTFEKALAETKAAAETQAKALAERDTALKASEDRAATFEKALAEAKAAAEIQAKALAERDATLKASADRAATFEKALADAKAKAETQAKALAERDTALKASEDRAATFEKELADAKAAAEIQAKALAERDATLKASEDRAATFEKALAETKAAAETQTKALAERNATLKASEDRATTFEKELADAKAKAETHAKALAERDTALKASEDRAATFEKALTEAKAKAETQAKALAERDTALKASEGRATTFEKALADAKAKTEAKEKSLAALRDRNAQLADDVQRSLFDQRKLAQDLGFAVRVQERLDTDLRDLRGQYTQLLTTKQQQENLLRQLTPRLQRAAEELQALSVGTSTTSQIRKPVADPASIEATSKRSGGSQRSKRKG
ncbi:hypothetical protein [Roseicitreum antarcticum]|uniref:Uncharacterized protein n=1 Tax=Roseicitreum antarcticum TaxID=564137 RepID=A0A1H3CR52_9RHOB|nr:hypothetical protein [Roseicitreum antarcticum]SDX56378.1 hypothetical protein SAMN04488238_11020 [Roseicitreum antarcticum]